MFTVEFLLTSLVVVLIPGTGVIYTINTGLTKRYKYSIAAAIGCTLGIIPHIVTCMLGLSAIMNMSARVFFIVKMMGSGYLMYLAWKTWKTAGEIEFSEEKNDQNLLQVIKKGIVLNLLNPKLTLFFLSFLPQFIPTNINSKIFYMTILGLVFMIMTLTIFIGYGLLASFLSKVIVKKKNIMKSLERGFACIFAGLAIKLALTKK